MTDLMKKYLMIGCDISTWRQYLKKKKSRWRVATQTVYAFEIIMEAGDKMVIMSVKYDNFHNVLKYNDASQTPIHIVQY